MGIYLIGFPREGGGKMKKFSLIVILILLVSLITSCGIGDFVNRDLKDDENIVEKANEEKNEGKNEAEKIEDKKSEDKKKEDIDENKKEDQLLEEKEEARDINLEEDKDTNIKREYKISSAIKNELKTIEKRAYSTVNSLNVRSLGSMKGKIITSIDRGVEVHVFGERDKWYYVEYAKNKKGWVYSKYIQFDPIKKPGTGDTSSLSNKSYSWYFIRNNKHQQPGFDKAYKALLDKYNGIAIGNKNKKDIFLTFDNGYENGYTVRILDILKRQNIKVAFFVQGTYIDSNPEIVKRMAREGHLVLNHTNKHPQMPSISQARLKEEINLVAQKYKKVTGRDMKKFLRPPSGVFSERSLADTKSLGYRTVFWSMAYRDWLVDDQPGKSAAYKHVVDNIHNGAVILLHSVSKSNTEALEDIIKELKRQGYNFKLLSEFP